MFLKKLGLFRTVIVSNPKYQVILSNIKISTYETDRSTQRPPVGLPEMRTAAVEAILTNVATQPPCIVLDGFKCSSVIFSSISTWPFSVALFTTHCSK